LTLSVLEISIIATTLVSISATFQQFQQSEWIVLSYLLTYTSFLSIIARLSDFFGRKNSLLAAMAFFTIFSGACGAAQSMNQL
jgi:MFS family permease